MTLTSYFNSLYFFTLIAIFAPQGINESLTNCGVKSGNVFVTYVPGAFELPLTAKLLAASKRVDVIICVGCLIKGDTMHFEYIAGESNSSSR